MSEKPKNFSQAIEDLESNNQSAGKLSDLGHRLKREIEDLQNTLHDLKPKVEEVQSKVSDEVKKAKGNLEEQVKQNPWTAIGIAGLLFFLIGYLLGRRRD